MKLSIDMPDKVFGIDSSLLVVYLPVLGLVLLLIVSFGLVFLPKWNDFQNNLALVNRFDQQKSDAQAKIQFLNSVDQSELKKNSQAISEAIMPQKNAYFLVGIVRKIADNYGFQIDSFTVNPGILSGTEPSTVTKLPSAIAKIPVTMSLLGSSDKYLELIKGIESSLPILSIEDFKMQNDGQTAKLDLTISSYYINSKAKVDPTKVRLSDLALTKSESTVLLTLGNYTYWGDNNSGSQTVSSYTNYNRTDPFTP